MATATLSAQQAKNQSLEFRRNASMIAGDLMRQWVGDERAQEAAGRISTALAASAASAKKPEEFYACTPQSIGACIAIAALTGIMPGTGATALAYLIPRRPRKDDPQQLTYQLSHRGLNALARRCGQTMVAVPIGYNDKINVNVDGEVQIVDRDIDNPPMEWTDLRGVVVAVREIATGLISARGWCPKLLIDSRRNASDSYLFAERKGNEWAQKTDPWHVWPVEMAMKCAMHYAISRGWCVIDDTEAVRSLNQEQQMDLVKNPPALGGSGIRTLADLTAAAKGDGEVPLDTPDDLEGEGQDAAQHDASDPVAGDAAQDADEKKNSEIFALKKLAETSGCPKPKALTIAERAFYEHAESPAEWISTKPWVEK